MAEGDHLYNCYAPAPQEFIRGEGPYLFTKEGDRYLDFIAGIAVNGLGHAHPKLIEAVKEQSEKLWHLSNIFRIEGQYELANKYCQYLDFAEKVFFTNSGAEAVECAMKTARRYQHDRGHPERYEIITFKGAFHGRTFATINAGGNPNYINGFGPELPGFISLPFGDHEALKAAISPQTSAIMVEPVQGEGGVRALPLDCLRGLRELCDKEDLVLIYDEVQCGAGRTGQLFAYEWAAHLGQKEGGQAGAEPDIMATAKGIGGGFPLGACFAREEIAQYMVPGTHGSTYGGNPMAMAVGNAVFDILTEDGFLEQVQHVSNVMTQQFEGLKDRFSDVVTEIRGKGLLRGLKLTKDAKAVRGICLDKGLLVGSAGGNVLRFAPPLIINDQHMHEAVSVLEEVFETARALDDVETL